MPRQKLELPLSLEDLKVLTLKEIAALEGTCVPTLRRQIAAGDGPPLIQLSARRRGIRVGDYRAWQESRVRSA
jgi:hypothetical protein